MAKGKRQNPDEEIEGYLTNEFNVEIYDELREGDEKGLFEPLAFFKLFYAQYEIIKANKAKPLTVVKHLTGLKLSNEQKWFLFDKLSSLISKESRINNSRVEDAFGPIVVDKQLSICQDRIYKEILKLEELIYQQEAENDEHKEESNLTEKFDFDRVKRHIETLPDTKAKLKYLMEICTDYEQQDRMFQVGLGRFDVKCKLEISKLLKLERLDKGDKPKAITHNNEASSRNPEFTMARQTLAMNFLLQYTQAKCPNTAKAEFIAFLTGKSKERIRKTLSNLYQTQSDNYTKWESDMNYVRKYFEALGLSEIVKAIDNELNSES